MADEDWVDMKKLITDLESIEVHYSERKQNLGNQSPVASDMDCERMALTTLSKSENIFLTTDVDIHREDIGSLIESLTALLGIPIHSKYISYSAKSCLKCLIRHMNQEACHSMLGGLQSIVNTTPGYSVAVVHSLDLMTSIIGGKSSPDGYLGQFACTAFSLVEEHWVSYLRLLPELNDPITTNEAITLHAVLALWIKLLKFNQNMVDRRPLNPSLIPSPSVVFNILENQSMPSQCVHKTLSLILNALRLPFDDSVKRLCLDIFDRKVERFLTLMPTVTNAGSFGGCYRNNTAANVTYDNRHIRKCVIIIVTATLLLSKEKELVEAYNSMKILLELDESLHVVYTRQQKSDLVMWPIDLFSDQDDQLIELLLSLLDIFITAKREHMTCNANDETTNQSSVSSSTTENPEQDIIDRFSAKLDPRTLYIHFLHHTSWDYSLLLDLLISPETCFLAYQMKCLKLILSDWTRFRNVCHNCSETLDITESSSEQLDDVLSNVDSGDGCSGGEEYSPSKRLKLTEYEDSDSSDGSTPALLVVDPPVNTAITSDKDFTGDELFDKEEVNELPKCPVLDKTMTVLIRLNLAVRKLNNKSLFPYNPDPIMKLIDQVELLYES